MSGPWILTSKGGKVLDWNREGSESENQERCVEYVVVWWMLLKKKSWKRKKKSIRYVEDYESWNFKVQSCLHTKSSVDDPRSDAWSAYDVYSI